MTITGTDTSDGYMNTYYEISSRLVEAVQNNKIKYLDFSERVEQASLQRLFDALQGNDSLETLRLRDCFDIDPNTLNTLSDFVTQHKRLKSLEIDMGFIFETEDISCLSTAIAKNKSITKLTLIGEYSGDFCAKILSHNKTITDLKVELHRAEAHDWEIFAKGLAQNRTLKSINLRNNRLVTDSLEFIAKSLIDNDILTTLNLSECHLTDGSIEKLVKHPDALQSIESLDLSRNPNIGDLGICYLTQSLNNNKLLSSLGIKYCAITEKSGPNLKALLETTNLKELHLDQNDLGSNGVKFIIEGLQYNTTLEVLGLTWCAIKTKGIEHLATLLKYNQHLHLIRLGDNQLNLEALQILADALIKNSTLRVLDLSRNDLRQEGINIIEQLCNLKKQKQQPRLHIRCRMTRIQGEPYQSYCELCFE